jgi:hypothetical protein
LRHTRGAKKTPKIVLKTTFKTKETTYTLVSEKYLVVSFQSQRAFSVFLEEILKKYQNRFGLTAPKSIKNR